MAAETITAWTYYDNSVFGVTPAAQAMVDYLNKGLAGKYTLQLQFIQRGRLEEHMRLGQRGVVMFAPSFVFGGQKGAYLWSAPFYQDQQEFVSRKDNPVNYAGPATLQHYKVGAIAGRVYPSWEKELAARQIVLARADSAHLLLRGLLNRTYDAATLPATVLLWVQQKDPASHARLYYSPVNLGQFNRHIVFQKGMEQERDELNAVLKIAARDPVWAAIYTKAGLAPPMR